VIKRKLDRYVQILNNIDDSQDKFLWIMDFGKNSRPMDDSLKIREFEVPGCQSQTWLVPHFVEDKIYFSADSAALISKGMVCIIADVYSGSTAQEINDFDQDKFEKLNLKTLLTPGRNNGVHGMLKKIKHYARA
jgi:cysteine desulfuration protein SufE